MRIKNKSGKMAGNGKALHGAPIDTQPPLDPSVPAGPLTMAPEHVGDLLVFVPRNPISDTIDELSGRYGYSHLAIDCGETDAPTGRRVMIEATMGRGVHYAFQDEYGKRAFVRLPLREVGVDVNRFCECVHSKVGEKFDDIEAISLGILDNPARQICSDLATVCLPEDMRQQIAKLHQRAVIHPRAAVRDDRPGPGFRLFMSPNGFAEFLGAPRGKELQGPDQMAQPHIVESKNLSFWEKLRRR